MRCRDPILCYTSNGKRLFRHFSLASPIFRMIHQAVFPCRTCILCRKTNAKELAMKCVLNASLYQDNCFLTLTHDEKRPGYHNNFDYKEIQDFKKRYRQHVWLIFKKRISIFNVHEYGANGKKHWHLIVFNHDFQDKTLYTIKNQKNIYTSKKLEELWPYGFNTVCDVTEASAMYQAQYMQKDFKYGHSHNEKKSSL